MGHSYLKGSSKKFIRYTCNTSVTSTWHCAEYFICIISFNFHTRHGEIDKRQMPRINFQLG